MSEEFEEQKVIVDLDGSSKDTKYEKVSIEEGQYEGKFVLFELKQMDKYGKPGEKEAKIIAQIKVQDKDKKDVEIPMFLTPIVTKAAEGSGKSNSTLFEMLTKLKLLDEFKDSNDVANGFSFKQLNDWLENRLLGNPVNVLVETTKKSKTPYSKVSKVFGFVNPIVTEKKVEIVH